MAASGTKNQGSQPMHFVEETLDETQDSLEKKKKKLLAQQQVKAPFLVGSIAEVNKRVSKLDRKLQSYTALVVESRNSDQTDDGYGYNYYMHLQDQNQAYEKRVREIQEVNQFAGIYAIKSTFLTKPSERAKHISQISMSPNKQIKKVETGKPRFVELHQFPGYDQDDLTELPFNISTRDVLRKVVDAQTKLIKTPNYLPECERLFYSQMSQAILQDLFWFVFLEKWTPNRVVQQGFFNRVAHNYVKLLLYAKHPQYRETFLKDYPSFLSQAVYVAFCESFPDSYRQFDDQFKEDVVNLIYEWVAGLRPAPRTWSKWNLGKLEPPNIKMRSELLNQSKSNRAATSSILDFSFLEQSPSYISGSVSTMNHGSTSSFSYHQPGNRDKGRRQTRVYAGAKRNSVAKKTHYDAISTVSGSETGVIGQIAQAQDAGWETGRTNGTGNGPLSTRRSKTAAFSEAAMKEEEERLTPIREFDEDEYNSLGAAKSYASFLAKTKRKPKESHPVGKGAEFSRGAFNTLGRSPLVAQFLRMQNLESEAQLTVLVQRSEIDKLPPVNGQTYADLTQNSYRKVKAFKKEFQKRCEDEQELRKEFVIKQKKELQHFRKRQAALLEQKREVKRLAELIMLEVKKDPDSVSANASLALQQALLAQSI